MNKYVLILADKDNCTLLVEKQSPEWQKGKFNLIGGKVEEGETLNNAAIREFNEETGLGQLVFHTEYIGYFYGNEPTPVQIKDVTVNTWESEYEVHLFVFHLTEKRNPSPHESEKEKIFWKSSQDLLTESRLMKNLKILIPLMRNLRHTKKDLVINDNGSSLEIESW